MDAVEIVNLITDGTRFRLIQLLLQHSYCVKALAKKLGISEPAVSQQLRILKQGGLVSGVKIGYQTHYQLDRQKIMDALGDVAKLLEKYPAGEKLTGSYNCSCEYIAECVKRDVKLMEADKNEK